MVAQNSILQRCFEEAASSSARALERCIDEAILSLQAQEAGTVKVNVRDRLSLAWNSLLKQRPGWPQAYAAGLRAAFKAPRPIDGVHDLAGMSVSPDQPDWAFHPAQADLDNAVTTIQQPMLTRLETAGAV